MPIDNPKSVIELNELARLCTDSAETYRRALDIVDSPRLAAFCKQQAEERDVMAGQLRIRVDEWGETAEEGGTVVGAAEKTLTSVKSMVGESAAAAKLKADEVFGDIVERAQTVISELREKADATMDRMKTTSEQSRPKKKKRAKKG